jgi:hypothetical protein
MKPFLLAILVAVLTAGIAELVITGYAQESSETAYASATSRP